MSTPGTVNYPASVDDAISLLDALNGATTTLTASLSDVAVTATVASTTLFPTTGAITLGGTEIAYYTGKTPTTFTGLIRGADGTTAAAHASADAVEGRIIARHHKVLAEAVIAIETAAAKLTVSQSFAGGQRMGITTLVSASNLIAVDLSLNNNFKITLAQNNTLSAPTNAVEGQSGVITLTQDATGSRTLAYNAFWDFSGAAPALSTAAGAIDHLSYYIEPGAVRARVQLSKES